MAIETVRRSDVSGDVIPDGSGARVRVLFADDAKDDLRADLTDEEVGHLLPWAKPVVARPSARRPGRRASRE